MSNDLVARLRLEANPGNTAPVLAQVERGVAKVGDAGVKAAGGLRQAETASTGFEKSAASAGRAGALLGTALAGIGGVQLIGNLKDAAFQLQGVGTGLAQVTGGAQNAASAQAYVREEASRLGLVVRQQTEGFMALAANTNGTALAGQKTRDIWLGLVTAGTALSRTDEQRARALEAVSQIAGKGIVSQEEIRQQLAEALPGAAQIAARAMGLTTQEFNKLVESGKLLSEDFLPKFAAQLQKEFGPQLAKSLTTPLGEARVELAELANIGDVLSADAGTAFLEGLVGGVRDLNDALSANEIRDAARDLGKDLGEGLALAAQGAAFLVDHLDEVQVVAAAVVGVGLSKWLITTAAETRAAAAAWLAKGVAAKEAAALATVASAEEVRAATTLRGALEATARAELQAATAARETAIANEQAAAAALTRARAEVSSQTGGMALVDNRNKLAQAEKGLALAQTATVAASGQAEVAATRLARVTTASGAAAQGAKALFGGLMSMLGGPWGVALLGAAAVVGSVTSALAENKRIQDDFNASTKSYADVMKRSADYLNSAADGAKRFGKENQDAVAGTNALAGAVSGLADQTLRLKSAKAQALDDELVQQYDAAGDQLEQLNNPSFGKKFGRGLLSGADAILDRYAPYAEFDLDGDKERARIRAELERRRAKIMGQRTALATARGSNEVDPDPSSKPTLTNTGKPDKAGAKAADQLKDLEALRVAEDRHTAALIAGGAALDQWQVEEAGRQAVERLGLADRPKLTAAQKALVEQIRTAAEETERLRIANDRVEKAVGIKRSAEADTKALEARSAAAAQGEAALDALQIQEAGLAALQQIGVDSLDQLTGKTREHAAAAVAAAEAKEAQAIATAKAERVAASLRDLDERIASETGYAEAVAAGADALIAYQREEAVRQELDRAGKNLTADQVAEIRKKTEALFGVKAAADSAALDKRQADELRLAKMTNQEREIETRYLERQSLIRKQHLDWTKEEVDARARALALADKAAAEDAQAIGDLREGVERAFVQSGKAGFEQVGDFVEQRLRQAAWDALVAKPFDILINATIGSLSGTNMLQGGGLGELGGSSGLLSLFNSAGALKGLTSSATGLATKGLGMLGQTGTGAANLAAGFGSAVGGAGTGMLVSSLAGMLGLKQTKGNQIGGAIGGAIGSFVPIPGGALIGAALGNLVGGLVGGKPSNHAAVVSLDSAGKVTSVGGAKRNAETEAAAKSIADTVAQFQAALVAGGATLTSTISQIDIGTRDKTHLNFSDGRSVDTAMGDVAAAIEAATKTILDGAKWGSEAATAYAQKLIAAGSTVDQVIATMQIAGNFGGTITDAISQLTDPAAYAKKQALDAIDANYKALKDQAQELIAAGLATEDVLGKIDQLKDLQTADALKRLGEAADGAASALGPDAFAKSIADGIAQLADPVAYGRAEALAEIEANYQALKAQAVKLVEAGKAPAEILADLDKLRDAQVADSVKRLGDAASDTAAILQAQADAQKAATDFGQGIDDAIAQLLDPVAFERSKAVRDIDANIDAMRATAAKMVAAGQLTGEVLTQLDELRDLQVADSIKRLGDAASDAADALADQTARDKEAAGFSGSIRDAILGIADPTALKKAKIQSDYDDRISQAKSMFSGAALADLVEQIGKLRDLELGQLLESLAGAVDRTTNAFEEARPRLRAWLDSVGLGSSSPLNPFEQRGAAMSGYQSMLASARSGDANALSQITSYADRLLSADGNATSSAADRLALYSQITSDIAGLTNMGLDVGKDPVVSAIGGLESYLEDIASYTDPNGEASEIAQPVEVANLIEIADTLQAVVSPQTLTITNKVDELAVILTKSLDGVRNSAKVSADYLTGRTDNGFWNVLVGLNQVVSAINALKTTSEEAKREAQLANALAAKAAG